MSTPDDFDWFADPSIVLNEQPPPQTANRLAKICGMFGSDHEGERASAALMADNLVKSLGLTWLDVFGAAEQAETLAHKLAFLLDHRELLSDWELSFVRGVSRFKKPSDRQLELVEQIVARVSDIQRRRAA